MDHKHIESKECPCNPVAESFREAPVVDQGIDLDTLLATVAGIPCRFCMGEGSDSGKCAECGEPKTRNGP